METDPEAYFTVSFASLFWKKRNGNFAWKRFGLTERISKHLLSGASFGDFKLKKVGRIPFEQFANDVRTRRAFISGTVKNLLGSRKFVWAMDGDGSFEL